jgi:hypothetical protein
MVRTPWATFLWPGLPLLWRGVWSGLALAIGSAALAGALVLATFVWVELLSPPFLRYAWMTAGALWTGSAIATLALGRWAGRHASSAEAMFRQAMHEYLKGNWFETERILRQLLIACPRDVEARLLLATLLRRTTRSAEALEELVQLELLRGASKWSAEVAAEKQWIASQAAVSAADCATLAPSLAAPPRAA